MQKEPVAMEERKSWQLMIVERSGDREERERE